MLKDQAIARRSTRRAADIRDVARKAGVAVGTVSRVVNGHPSVTPAKRQLVLDVIAELNYRPDAFARSLRQRRSNTLGVIIPDIRNPFFAELIQCVEIRARALGYSVIFVTSDEDQDTEAEHIATLAARKVDAILWAPSNRACLSPDSEGVRIVALDRPIEGLPSVTADNRAGARLAVEHLVGLGHRRIACISGPKESTNAAARLAGFLDVMAPVYATEGLRTEDYVIPSAYDYLPGEAAAEVLLTRLKPSPTAIVAGSDQQAIGALRAAADLGFSVPRDLSIVGFDGIPLSQLVTPRLTTVVQPVAKMAEAAVELALGDAGGGERLACELVVRDSTAPPRH